MEALRKKAPRYFRPAFVFLGACGLWAVRMPLVQAYYERTLRLGYYRPEADSIGIAIAGEAVFTFLAFPVLILCLYFILRRFPDRCSWLAWNNEPRKQHRPKGAPLPLLLVQAADFLSENWQLGLHRNVLVNVCWILLWLELRAVIVSKITP